MDRQFYPRNRTRRWLAGAILGMLAGALLLSVHGCSFSEAKWVSPEIADAEARQMQVEADHQAQTYQNDERLQAAQVDLQIADLEHQKALQEIQHQQDVKEIEAAATQQALLRQSELEHQAAMQREQQALLQQQQQNLQAEEQRRAQRHQQELAEQARQAALAEERERLVTWALFAGLLILFGALSFALLVYSRRQWPVPAQVGTVVASVPTVDSSAAWKTERNRRLRRKLAGERPAERVKDPQADRWITPRENGKQGSGQKAPHSKIQDGNLVEPK